MDALHPNERVETARNQLGMAQLKISTAARRGALTPEAVEIVSQRIGNAQVQMNRLPRYPAEQPAEAEVFFAGASLEDAVSVVLNAAMPDGEAVGQLAIDKVVNHLREHISDAELRRLGVTSVMNSDPEGQS